MSINQFQMTGDVSVIVRTIAPTTINGVAYQAKEVITSFTADVTVNYTDIETLIRTEKNQLSKNSVFADTIQIIPKQLNDGVYNLIGKRLTGDISVPFIRTATSNSGGSIFLNTEISPKDLIIKDSSSAIVNPNSYSVDVENGTISGLTAETEYKIYYYAIKSPIASLTFENIALPYLRLELVGKGNINNESKSFMVVVPKAQVNSAPQMNFTNSSIVNVILSATVINLADIELHYF
jgi:hypothetical protein